MSRLPDALFFLRVRTAFNIFSEATFGQFFHILARMLQYFIVGMLFASFKARGQAEVVLSSHNRAYSYATKSLSKSNCMLPMIE